MTSTGDTAPTPPTRDELMAASGELARVEPAPPRDDPALVRRRRLAELMAKPLLELSVAEAIFLALVLDGDESEEDLLAELLEEQGLPLP